MKDLIKKRLNEDFGKTDAKDVVKKYIDTKEFKSKIETIVKDIIKKDKDLEDRVVDINKSVLTQLYKALWVKNKILMDNIK